MCGERPQKILKHGTGLEEMRQEGRKGSRVGTVRDEAHQGPFLRLWDACQDCLVGGENVEVLLLKLHPLSSRI